MSERTNADYMRLHLRFGWWSLLVFLLLGLVLETLHGFKIGWYLDVSNSIRRFEESQELPFSDTLEIDARRLGRVLEKEDAETRP